MKKNYFFILMIIIGCYVEHLSTPKTTIIKGPYSGSIINRNLIEIVWRGEGCDYYQYSIDGKVSEWTKEESILLILDDGWHYFWVRGKNILEEKEKDYPYLYFCVDGIKNGFGIFPIFDSVRLWEEINIKIKGESLKRHNFEYIKLVWNNELSLTEFTIDTTVFLGNSKPVVITKVYSCSLEIYRASFDGFQEGDINIGNFKFFSSVKGIFDFMIKDAKIFDSLGLEIKIDTLSGGKIVVF